MKRIFLEELDMYLADHPLGEKIEKLPPILADKKFTEEVEPGDIRLFADVFPPRSGLFYKKHPSGMWIVIPLSNRSFTVPASNEEALVGDNVYQFWNEILLPDSTARRSYFETQLSNKEMSAVGAVLCHLRAGYPIPKNLPIAFGEPITRSDDPRLKYFKAFRMKLSDFVVDEQPEIVDIPWNILPPAVAAAGGEMESPSFMLCCKENLNEEYVESHLAMPFCSLLPDYDPGVLTFKYDGVLPVAWNVGGIAPVTMHDRTSRRQIGSGHIDVAKHEIVIDDFSWLKSLTAPIKSAAELVIVIVAKRGKK